MNSSPIRIDIASDIVCPWCYIGKRRLEAALQLFAKAHPAQAMPQLRWLPFQLNPDLPPQGISRADYLQRKFGSPDGGGIYAHVSAEGKNEGLDFNFSAITRQPNTLRAHTLLAAAQQSDQGDHSKSSNAAPSRQTALKEALMQAYFCQGADLTQDATLLHIAQLAGLPAELAHAALQDTAAQQDCAAQDAQLRRMGISGVPYFIVNQKYGISGAQPPQALLAAMEQALSSSEI